MSKNNPPARPLPQPTPNNTLQWEEDMVDFLRNEFAEIRRQLDALDKRLQVLEP